MAPTTSTRVAALAITIGTGKVQSSGEGPGTASGSPVSRSQQRCCMQLHLRKTKLCLYFPKGTCQYGDGCIFAHSSDELQSLPDLSKTRLCPACEQGGRCNDKDCSFAHSEEELRSTNLFYKKNLCIWNEKGKCKNGDQCCFAHGTSELQRKQGGNRRRGSPGAVPAPSKQTAAKGGDGAVALQEPMKVLAVGCLPAPQPVALPATLPAYVSERDRALPGAPGLPMPPDGYEDFALPGPTEAAAAWWQGPFSYGMAPVVADSMLGVPGRCEPYTEVPRDPRAHGDDEPKPFRACLKDADPATVDLYLKAVPGLLLKPEGLGA